VKGFFFPPARAALFLLVLLAPVPCPAQEGAPYLIPQTVFVGDRGRLVVPLGQAFIGAGAFVREAAEELPRAEDIVITRMELEHRNGNARLLIDFIPYAPGILPLPPLAIPVPGGDLELTGLEAAIASILGPQEASLSNPAPPLAAPGAAVIMYGTAAGILAFLFLCAGVTVWLRRNFASVWEALRRRRLLRAMVRFLKRLSSECQADKNKNQGELLSLLSVEFREFLSLFTGINCRALTAGEFSGFAFYPVFLCAFFRRCDTLRFSGKPIEAQDLRAVLTELVSFIETLIRSEKERRKTAGGTPVPAGEAS
jgi:hypothetical protein